MRVTVDKFGRIVIPKEVRDELGIKEGTGLNLEFSGEALVLTPGDTRSPLAKKGHVLIFKGIAEGDLSRAVNEDRARRIKKHQTFSKT